MVFTSPLVVTVGLTLTIPLSLVGEMVLQGSTKGLLYWFGAAVVVASFVFVDREEVKEEEGTTEVSAGTGGHNSANGGSVLHHEMFTEREDENGNVLR